MEAMQQTWDPSLYAGNGRFVALLAGSLVDSLQPRAGDRVLDLGCGDGFLTQRIGESGATVVGVDSSLQMIEAAKNEAWTPALSAGRPCRFMGNSTQFFPTPPCTG
jgi:2-polyprenyl-3-methyl-5-hydroxy-6-metoxy-1,4-benzoquinol methylase